VFTPQRTETTAGSSSLNDSLGEHDLEEVVELDLAVLVRVGLLQQRHDLLFRQLLLWWGEERINQLKTVYINILKINIK
jgi:hypothetical protein